jgi:hypothetical protein
MIKRRRYKTNVLFPKTSLLDGFGSIMNVAGNYFRFNYSESGEEADNKAIANDWGVVGDDIRNVIQRTKQKSIQYQF